MTNNRTCISSAQLYFHFEHDPEFLVRTFERAAGMAVMLVLTDNTTSMLSVSKKGTTAQVRLHRMFLRADEETLREIASFIKRGGGRMPRFRAFVNEMRDTIRRKPARSFPVRTQGKYYDLRPIFERLNNEYFEGKLASVITWGSSCPGQAVRKRTLGSYSSHSDTIRINPVLDRKTVPLHYIEFIVYHEMLHAAMGTEKKNGRRAVHTRDFRKRELLFKDYEKSVRWEKERQG